MLSKVNIVKCVNAVCPQSGSHSLLCRWSSHRKRSSTSRSRRRIRHKVGAGREDGEVTEVVT